MKRKAAFVSIADDDSDTDNITSYCPKCAKYNVQSLLGPRIYDEGEPVARDDDLWMMCRRCGLLIAKVHAQRETKLKGFIDTPDSIYDSGKVTVLPFNERSNKHKQAMQIIRDRPEHDTDQETIAKKDKDIAAMLAKGKQLVSYNSNDSG